MTAILGELRATLRRLRRTPLSTFAAAFNLAVGIGATAAIFTAVSTALLDPLPFREPDRLVSVFRTTPHFDTGPFSAPNFEDLHGAADGLDGLAAIGLTTMHLDAGDRAEQVSVGRASDDLFEILGRPPLEGRVLAPGDGGPDAPRVAVIAEELWHERLGGDPGLVGRTVRLEGLETTIVGVLPKGFRVPHGGRVFSPDVWVPLRFTADETGSRRSNFLNLVGRLRPTVGLDAADAALKGVMAGIIEQHPELEGEQLRVVSLRAASVESIRRPLSLLQGAVVLVLLIAVSNTTSLLLARAATRRGELGIRAALGAGSLDVQRIAYLESATVTLAGTVTGVVLAWGGVDLLAELVPSSLPQLADLHLDLRVLGFAVGIAFLATIASGLAPAWQARHTDPQEALRTSGRSDASPGQHRFLRTLVAAEIALSLVLLLGAGLMLRGFARLAAQEPGFDADRLLTMEVSVPPDAAASGAVHAQVLEPLLERLRAVPGVEEAAVISLLPYENWGWNFNVLYEGQTAEDPTRLPLVETRAVTPTLFDTLGLHRLRGRGFEAADDEEDHPLTVIVNRALVDRDFPGEDPLGKRFYVSDTELATIVGVVSDSKNTAPDRPPFPAVYWSWGRQAAGATSFPLVVRVAGDPARLAPTVAAAVREAVPRAAVRRVRPMTEVMADSMGRPRFYLALLATFAGVALLLALAGLYGVMSYYVAQRRIELGVRAAVGGTPARLVGRVAAQGLMLVAIGLACGLGGAWAITRLLAGMLYGVDPLDPATWAAGCALFLAVNALAIVGPARRAALADPLVALRRED